MATTVDIDGNYQVVVSNHSNWMLQRRLDDKGKVFTTVDSRTKEVKPRKTTGRQLLRRLVHYVRIVSLRRRSTCRGITPRN